MGSIDWKKLAAKAKKQTVQELSKKISSLTRLNDEELIDIINESKIDKDKFVEVLEIVKDITLDNKQKAEALSKIDKGVGVLVRLIEKLT